ncbi:FMN reductase [Ochrobactrum sp. GPK 3]|uniref:FMN reductase n=1 Tax=Brucella/Ochrobactrum group TaxID=2826938 RepID=UPI0031385433
MTALKLVGLAGSFNRPSKTLSLVQHIAERASAEYGFEATSYDLHDVGPSLGRALWRNDLDEQAEGIINQIVAADVLVVGSPTFKGSYPGLFKHLIDLIDPQDLRGKPVVIAATGGGDKHALIVEHQLRPLFGFFSAHTLPSAIYASEREFTDYRVSSEPLFRRIEDAVSELGAFFPKVKASLVAAE